MGPVGLLWRWIVCNGSGDGMIVGPGNNGCGGIGLNVGLVPHQAYHHGSKADGSRCCLRREQHGGSGPGVGGIGCTGQGDAFGMLQKP